MFLESFLGETVDKEILDSGCVLSAMHSARKVLNEAESSEKISGSLCYQTRQTVYFKRNDSNEWRVPGKVIVVDKQTSSNMGQFVSEYTHVQSN